MTSIPEIGQLVVARKRPFPFVVTDLGAAVVFVA
jgi:hypothetical protein